MSDYIIDNDIPQIDDQYELEQERQRIERLIEQIPEKRFKCKYRMISCLLSQCIFAKGNNDE